MTSQNKMDLSPADLIAALLAELGRVYGRDYAQACILDYNPRGGWFLVSYPRQRGRRWEVNPITQPMRRRDVEALLAELRHLPK